MNTTTTPYEDVKTATVLFGTKGRDKYGRSIVTFELMGPGTRKAIGAVVRLPKVAIEAGQLPYLSNDWTTAHIGDVKHHRTRREALARMESVAAKLGAVSVYYR
jgi:hypothetical protein